VDLFLKMGDVKVKFEILIHCFMQWPSYFLRCTPSSSTFVKTFISFDSSLFQMFGHLLGPGSFDSLGLLTHKQSSFTITFGGIGFIPIATITLTTYLKSWALVISIIIIKFMVDQCFIFLKILTRVDNNTFPFQQHFKATCNLLLSLIHACFLPFE